MRWENIKFVSLAISEIVGTGVLLLLAVLVMSANYKFRPVTMMPPRAETAWLAATMLHTCPNSFALTLL